jgi:hypothetical protein
MVMVGVVVGAMVEIDWASVSTGERMPGRRPDGAVEADSAGRVCSIRMCPFTAVEIQQAGLLVRLIRDCT